MAKTGIFKREAIVIVVAVLALPVLALIMTVMAPQVINYLGKAQSNAAGIMVEKLSGKLDLYRIETGDYPGQTTGLQALLKQPSNTEGWNGPYVERPEQLSDPWGRRYLYRYPGEHGAFDLYSLGKDGRVGGDGEDRDITSWW